MRDSSNHFNSDRNPSVSVNLVMSEQSSSLTTELTGSVAIIRFNHPPERNPLSIAALNELRTSFSTVTGRENVEAVIFTGTDSVVASGADIRELTTPRLSARATVCEDGAATLPDDSQRTAGDNRSGQMLLHGRWTRPSSRLQYSDCLSECAVPAHSGVRLEIITGWGGHSALPTIIGKARALDFFATARRVSSQEALEIGLITQIHDLVLESLLTWPPRSSEEKAPSRSPAPANTSNSLPLRK